jgi:SAM-dependent methyltransferase
MESLRSAIRATLPAGAQRTGRRGWSATLAALTRPSWTHSLRFLLRSRQAVFSKIYASQAWGSEESGSGTGSELRATENIRVKLPEILRRIAAGSFLDAPCGDWNWMQHVDLPVERYYGFDIVPTVIAENRHRFARPGVEFEVRDLTKDALPKVDIVMCRDCLVHLAYADIRAVLANLKRTGAAYILVNTYPQATSNTDQFTGANWRQLDMTRPPFSFPPPIEAFPDGGEVDPNLMGLWRLQELPDLTL